MSKESTIQDLKVWQKAKDLAVDIYSTADGSIAGVDAETQQKLRTLAFSIFSNVTKGYERRSRKEFSRYLMSAKSGCFAFQAFLHLIKDLKMITEKQFSDLHERSLDIVKMSSGLIKSLAAKNQ